MTTITTSSAYEPDDERLHIDATRAGADSTLPGEEPDGDCLYDVQKVARRLSISVRSVWRHAGRDDGFPKPISVGRAKRWTKSSIDDYIQRLSDEG